MTLAGLLWLATQGRDYFHMEMTACRQKIVVGRRLHAPDG
jgi:hypothetical protein